MPGLISRRPLVGLVAGSLFGSLGYLLLGVEDARGMARYLFPISGYSFLFVAAVALLTAARAFLRDHRSR
jgi:carbon starvation protein CstA